MGIGIQYCIRNKKNNNNKTKCRTNVDKLYIDKMSKNVNEKPITIHIYTSATNVHIVCFKLIHSQIASFQPKVDRFRWLLIDGQIFYFQISTISMHELEE